MGHSPDKACESFFGFNSVLPGAYSLFRWKAIKGEPLDEFFRSVTRGDFPSCAEANEFLAEDRVMCLQIYIKKHCKFHLAYVPDAKAFTDAPDSLAVLIKQRRRWMNGAMFGTVKVISNFVHMLSCRRTKHSCCRQFMMFFFLIYYITTFLFQFFTVGSMYASITIFLK
jgi:chitin synthase